MTIILPHYPNNFADVLGQLNNVNWNTWNESFEEYTVKMRLPKFEMEYSRELTRELSDMGMESAFGNADFSGISNNSALKLSEVIHKTFISIDEKGTEAAAVTLTGGGLTSPDPNAPVNFTVNRPFIFMINEAETGHVVFLGKVLNPNE